MHPAFLDAMSWEMAEVYGAITDQILINLARHFPFYVAGEDLPKSAFAYQAQMLAQMGQVNAETMRIIRNGLADADPALVNCLEQSIIDAVNGADKDLAKAVKKGIFAPPAAPVLSPNQYKAFNLYYTQAADKLNLVNTVMLESTQSAYRQAVSDVISEIEIADRINRTQIALDAAAGETVTGVSSWNQALRHAADKLNDGGIVGFIDHAGRRWSAEAYVAMDIRTTVFNTGRAAVWETNQNFGNDLYSVSYHNGARPLCYPWQNKVISSLDAARTVIDLDGNEIEVIAQSATSYGAPAGLFGINCKHYPTPFIPGVSVLTGQPQSKEENERVYAESQTQREMERTLREQKRDYLTAKAQGRPKEELDYLQGKCRETSGQIDEFCKKTGRARHRDREGVYTKREFPDAKKYDVSAFERDQKKMIDGFFDKGGAQQNFTAGQMTPNVPLVPKTPTPAPATPATPVTPTPAPVAPATPVTPTPATPIEQAQETIASPEKTVSTNIENIDTLKMYGEAVEWSEDAYRAEMENLREGWKNVPSQIDAFDTFEKEVPKYEKALKDAVEREDFAIRTSSGDVVKILEDGRFKSQIETGASHGYLDTRRRKIATQQLFAGSEPLDVADSNYEIYGYLGDAPRAKMYGNTRIVLKKDNIIDRTTLTVGDSLELLETGADPMATLATEPQIMSYGKVFSDSVPNAPDRLKDVQRDFASIADKGYLSDGNYVELQFHGGLSAEDIEYIEMSKSDANAQAVEKAANDRGVKIKWK